MRAASASPWIRVERIDVASPAQGWKLHVSATLCSAAEVLRRVLPVLLAEDATWKVASSPRELESLNAGRGGLGQAGKFLTVYPGGDAQAVRLARALDEATRGLRGPEILSERALSPRSLVSYRYGAFGRRWVQNVMGMILPAISDPEGRLVPDVRAPGFCPPWVVDPFVAEGVAGPVEERNPLIEGRYLLTSKLYTSPRGAVYLAADTHSSQRCVLKQARRDAGGRADGTDARDRLRHEAQVLERIAGDARFPRLIGLAESNGDLFLAMEDVPGATLEQHVNRTARLGSLLGSEQVVAWAREVAAMLGEIHARGLVYRDLKPSNVIIAQNSGEEDGKHDEEGAEEGARTLRLLDFDIAMDIGAPVSGQPTGTRGYMSPEHVAGEPASPQDDVFGLGALLFFMATGAEPAAFPYQNPLASRSPSLLNPRIPPQLEAVILTCLEPVPRRFASMAEVDAALAAIEKMSQAPSTAGRSGRDEGPSNAIGEVEARRRSGQMARRVGDTLCRAAEPMNAPDGGEPLSLAWASTHHQGSGTRSLDINAGNAGVVLALAELCEALGEEEHRRTLEAGARWLARAPRLDGPVLPGLYVGESGVGAALLRAGQVLGDAGLVALAEQKGRLVQSLPFGCPDLFNGTAGRLRFHLLLWDATQNAEHLSAALSAGQSLLDAAQVGAPENEGSSGGEVRWVIPPGYGGLSGTAPLGYSHGAAGIADALLDLFEATQDERFLAPARGAARWLESLATSAPESRALNWPTVEGREPASPFWCHGATGIGRFFLHAARLEAFPDAWEIAARAALSASEGARWANPTQCHGLAGNIELLLDMFQATGEARWLSRARVLEKLLQAFAVEWEGALLFPSESPTVFSPDYMVGYGGVASCLLRLADPEKRPHGLSRAGFGTTQVQVLVGYNELENRLSNRF